MIPPTTPRKVYVNNRKEAVLTCPSCHNTKLVNFAPYLNDKSPIKAKCLCGCVFAVLDVMIESRKFFRKRTRLPGSYAKTVMDTMGCMTVTDVSFRGIRFQMEKEHDLAVEEVLGVRFVLDDHKHTEIRRTAVIRHIQGRCIGAEFCDTPGYDMDLIYYLMLS